MSASLVSSVGDPDSQDPLVFGPPGPGSISQIYGSGSGSGPFSQKGFEWTERFSAKKNVTQYFSKKLNIETEDYVPASKLLEKYMKKIPFCILNLIYRRKESDP